MSESEKHSEAIGPFTKLKSALSAEHEARRQRAEALQEFAEYLHVAKGKHFIISAFSDTAGFKGENGWTFVPTRSIREEPKPFEPREMVIGNVGNGQFPVSGTSVELFYPGNEDHKLLVSLNSIISIEAVAETVTASE